MNTLQVPYFAGADINMPFVEIDALLSGSPPQFINCEPWSLPGQKPLASFHIGHGVAAIFLKFNVKEQHYKADYTRTNDLVYKDSCVEFFFAPDASNSYYNFEFNSLGTAYAAYGTATTRELLSAELISGIRVLASNKNVPGNEFPIQWELTLEIPFKTFVNQPFISLRGKHCRANFYKCGDDLPEPHFLCWNNITWATPNFHLPQYFGQLVFE